MSITDELREWAEDWDGSNMFELARMCSEAADTITELQAENAKLREQLERLQPTDCEGNVLDIADTVHMLRSEYDGDHEWEDVVTELVLTKWGGDRWIVRGSKGEAWACDCERTGYDEEAYDNSDDAEPIDNPMLIEAENAKLRELVSGLHMAYVGALNEAESMDAGLIWEHCEMVDDELAKSHSRFETDRHRFDVAMRELGIEVPD